MLLDAALDKIPGRQRRTSPTSCKVCCVAHEDTDPSLHLSETNGMLLWRCHAGCDQQAVGEAFRLLGVDTGTASPPVGLPPVPDRGWTSEDFRNWMYACLVKLHDTPEALSYLASRGITQDEAERYGIGYGVRNVPAPFSGLSDRIIVTVGTNAAEGRTIRDEKPKWKTMQGTVKWAWWADGGGPAHVMVEGVFDAIAVARFGAVGIAMRGLGSLTERDLGLLRMRGVKNVYVCPDRDKREDSTVLDKWMASAAKVARPWLVRGDRWGDLGDYLTFSEDAFCDAMSEAMAGVA